MKQRSPLLPIFLIVLVDVLGFTIVIPLLAFYAEHFGASPLVATLIVSCYAVCSLISTPVIGKLSDQFGRRPLLMISQAGTCLGFLILGFSTALWMVFVGRILDGITAGNLSLAQAYISDHTKPENRAKAFGVIGIAFGIGFSFGPTLGGALAKYGVHVPFILAAGLSMCSMIATYTLLPRDKPTETLAPATTPAGPGGKRPGAFDFATYGEFFRRPGLRNLYAQFFLFSFAFSMFMSGFALFAERRFITHGHGWTAREVGYLFGYTGVIGIIWQGGLIGRLVKKFGEIKLVLAGFISVMVAYGLLGVIPGDDLLMIGIVATIASFGNSVLRPVITSRITQVAGRHEQGTAIGISGSLSSVAMTLAPPVGGLLITQGWLTAWALAPGIVAILGLLAAFAGAGGPADPHPAPGVTPAEPA